MRRGALLGAALAITALIGCAVSADDAKKSGGADSIAAGDSVPAFHPYNVTGVAAGQERCLV